MMMNSSIARSLFALAAALVATPLMAAEPLVVSGQQQSAYQEKVSFADLDLRNWWAQQTLKRRVSNASERVCNLAEGPFLDYAFAGRKGSCTENTYADARPQIVAAIDSAKTGQQFAMSLLVSSPAKAR